MNTKIDEKRENALSEIKHTCKCGHVVLIPEKYDFVYCDHCWKRVYKNKMTEFRYKLLETCRRKDNE